MDSDYSHSPADITKLMANMIHGCDLVIGSRYCNGGKTKDWSALRLVISKIANIVASIRIGARISDYTSGFRCYSLDLIKKIINDLHSQTYEIQIETIKQAHLKGFKIRETPITFTNRKRGKSKLTFNEIKGFLSYILLKR
jgi:dolichol-phosphate mannosyltransferase